MIDFNYFQFHMDLNWNQSNKNIMDQEQGGGVQNQLRQALTTTMSISGIIVFIKKLLPVSGVQSATRSGILFVVYYICMN